MADKGTPVADLPRIRRRSEGYSWPDDDRDPADPNLVPAEWFTGPAGGNRRVNQAGA